MAWQAASKLEATEAQVEVLKQWASSRKTEQRVALRSKIVLRAIRGDANNAIASELGVSRPTVLLWRDRFSTGGPDALAYEFPRGTPFESIPKDKADAIVHATLQTKPKAETHWSVRTMARAQGVSPASVQRLWVANELKPHLVRTFKISRDKQFVEKLNDVVGLYLNPPEHAIVISVDEKSGTQALDRTQPGLPLKRGRCGTMTHDYKRNGTTTLFAALNVLNGLVIAECMPNHRHQEFLAFLKRIDKEISAELAIHAVVDNYATHKHPAVQRWLKRHPRFHLHFVPTSASWLNLVERWFRDITDKAIRRGVFRSVTELVAAIEAYVTEHNQDPKPFVWTATADQILAKVRRGKAKLEAQVVAKP